MGEEGVGAAWEWEKECVVGWVKGCCGAGLGGSPNTQIFKDQVGSHMTFTPLILSALDRMFLVPCLLPRATSTKRAVVKTSKRVFGPINLTQFFISSCNHS